MLKVVFKLLSISIKMHSLFPMTPKPSM